MQRTQKRKKKLERRRKKRAEDSKKKPRNTRIKFCCFERVHDRLVSRMVREEHLGYDRPSKAVDWLIKKAKNSIDKLAELPPWHPTENLATEDPDPHAAMAAVAVDSTEMGLTVEKSEFSGCIDSWAMSTRTQIIITGRDSFLINISRWIPTP
ncbi:hypothetical protein F8388_015823 [Cannabis sativa]|uniref:TCP domain-containing protein n=1 Tax=Cannabis sativa TaxID=3483 RepID=A0A7J6FHC6_CANSA|nr:hypothetical protein F8388_015823 [Cannabis sativa]